MNDTTNKGGQDEFVLENPQSSLEKMYLEAFLNNKGYTMETIQELPKEDARRLMKEASMYASSKLAEVESRAQFRKEIHGTTQST